MKAVGAEIMAFWKAWPPGDDVFTSGMSDEIDELSYSDGDLVLNPTMKYDLADFGDLFWQGDEEPPRDCPYRRELISGEGVTFEKWFKRWKSRQTRVTLAVEVGVADVEEFKRVCKMSGWKVT